jgi:hypothetical protein
MTTTPVAQERPTRRVSRRGMVVFLVAAIAIVVAAVAGVRGLLASPIVSVAADGTAKLQGTWEPYTCDAHLCQGYIQAGSRSVFVVLSSACPHPQRAARITITGRPDRGLGTGSYRATGCAS